MSVLDPLDPTLAAWLDSGPTRLPDATRRSVAAGIRATRQQRPLPSVRVGRGAPSRFQALGVAAALVGVTILGVLAATGGPDPSPRDGPTTSSPTPVDRGTTGSVTFTSTLYGYTLRHPAEWTAEPATERWTGGAWAELDAATDVLFAGSVRPRISSDRPWLSPWFTAKALSVPPETTATSWADSNVPRRIEQTLEGGTVCRYGNSYIPMGWPPEWKDTTIGGEPGRIRAACGFVDAVVVLDGQAFLFSMYTHFGANRTEPFEVIARTIIFTSAAGSPFVSDVYGYAARYPAGWTVVRATRPWVPGELPSRTPLSDRFEDPDVARSSIVVASAKIPDGLSESAWRALRLPSRQRCGMGGLLGRVGNWEPIRIDGREGHVRSGCGSIDAVVVAERRAYAITVSGPYHHDGATPETRALFDAFVATIKLRPDDAVMPDLPR